MPRFFAPRPQPVHVLVVLDESSSMTPYTDKVERALRGFLDRLKQEAGEFLITLVTFSDSDRVQAQVLARPPAEAPFYYQPWGATALWDGIGIALQAEPLTQATAVCLIASDGGENVSRHFNQAQIYAQVRAREWSNRWTFLWLNMQGSENREAKALEIECLDFSREDIVEVLTQLAVRLAGAVSRMRLAGERKIDIKGLLR